MKNVKQTKSSNHKSESINTSNPEWLSDYYNKRKLRSIELGFRAIDSLLSDGKSVSYRSVSLRSKEIDPDGKGIHANTIKSNEQLNQYYHKHCKSKGSVVKSKNMNLIASGTSHFRNIKLDRNIESVMKRYARLSKGELILLLVNAEQYIAEQNKRWFKNEFEQYK